MTAFIKTSSSIHIVFDTGESATIYTSNPQYEKLMRYVKLGLWNEVRNIAFPSVDIAEQLQSQLPSDVTNRVRISHGIIQLDGTPIDSTLTVRMINMLDEGLDITPMARFLENLMDNSSSRSVDELYGFLEASRLPITEDGHFLAYKRVSSNFKDLHSGTLDNTPGKVVQMARLSVQDDKYVLCSTGLHFCAKHYLDSCYSGNSGNPGDPGDRTVIVKINPRDVVSIPIDYNNAKGRCCRYEVIKEITTLPQKAIPIESETLEDTQCISINNTPSRSGVRQFNKDDPTDTLMVFASVHAAFKATGISTSYITRVCNGKRKTTGGFGWEWADVIEQSINQTKPLEDGENGDYDGDDGYWLGDDDWWDNDDWCDGWGL